MAGLIGRKVGMTQIFKEDGVRIPVTVIDVSDNVLQRPTHFGDQTWVGGHTIGQSHSRDFANLIDVCRIYEEFQGLTSLFSFRTCAAQSTKAVQ